MCLMVVRVKSRGWSHLSDTHVGAIIAGEIRGKACDRNRREQCGWRGEVRVTLTSNTGEDQWEGRTS